MTETRRIRLTEASPLGVRAELTRAEAAALSATGFVEIEPSIDGSWRLRPGALVGAIRVGNVQVDVWPKERVKIGHLIFMLGYAINPGFRPDTVFGDAHDELWPALAESMARLGERALAHGVLQGYRTLDESSTVVRGRIRIGDQLRARPARAIPLEVSFDEYLIDVPENRILRTALRRMASVPRNDPAVRARLRHLDSRLSGVDLLRPRHPRPAWRPTRLNEHYQPALRLAEVILDNTSAETGQHGLEIASFAVSMWKVFEDFITVALQESFANHGALMRAQYRSNFDEPRSDWKPRVPMAVDLVHVDHGSPRTVLDAKYKAAAASGRYPNADLYQMLAYCTALKVTEAVLVYAQGDVAATRRVRHSGVEITEVPIDLSAPPREILAAIDRITVAVLERDGEGRIDLSSLQYRAFVATEALRKVARKGGTRVK